MATNDAGKLTALAAVYNTWTTIGSKQLGWKERIAPGAFRKVLNDPATAALFNHNPDHVLGRRRSGTLQLREEPKGLRYTVTLPPTSLGRDLAALAARGDIVASSFSFMVEKGGDEWSRADDGWELRTIKTFARLYDVSPVTYAAYPTTGELGPVSLVPPERARSPRSTALDTRLRIAERLMAAEHGRSTTAPTIGRRNLVGTIERRTTLAVVEFRAG
ncbi:MAG: HK97 family phage prohead protease [Acidimicrobiia bacterium]